MGKLDISNVITVTLLQALRGLSNVNTSALAIITDDVPIPGDYGTAGIYRDPIGVGEDFGTDSDTYNLSVSIFGQKPNILTGGGYLVIIPRLASAAAQPAVLSGTKYVDLTALTAEDYYINVDIDGGGAADILIGEIDRTNLESIQTSLNSYDITAAGLQFILTGDISAAKVELRTVDSGASKSIEIGEAGTGTDIASLLGLPVDLEVTGAATGTERVKDCILRTSGAVEYFGIVLNEKLADAVLLETAALVQTLDKIMIVGSSLTADIAGIFTTLKDSGYTHTRCVLYTISAATALTFAAAYAGRAFSVNFSGANTAQTMHLKDIVGFVADSGLSQTLLTAAKNAGVDIYPDFGVPKTFISGENMYFDQIYSRLALKLFLQVAGFNYLAQTNTKIPQTEEGMNGLKGAYRRIMDQFVGNGTFSPGTWLGSTRFGNPEDHDRNIQDFGYFIYSLPISQQSQAVRDIRKAPLVQIAAKDAGAIHSSDVVVLVEA
jgi:hypothetical protein